MTSQKLPDDFVQFVKSVRGKRSQIVVKHILEHGFISTEDLEQTYGYRHPPRAVADVREQGVPIETFTVTSSQGKKIAAYRFGNPADRKVGQRGRMPFPKGLKTSLYLAQDGKCSICNQAYAGRYLQIDHRIPYLVAGEVADLEDMTQFMLLCRSCNRAKSWSCEHCPNGIQDKDPKTCVSCYWATPEGYEHIATRQERRVDLVWSEDDVVDYEQLVKLADQDMGSYIKRILKIHIEDT